MSENNVPEVRFRVFSGEWKKKMLRDVSPNTYGGGTPNTAINEYWSGNIPWIQSSDLVEHDVSSVFVRKRISNLAISKSATKIIPKASIAVVTRVGVGKLAIIPFQYATSQDFLSLSNLVADKWFTVYSLYGKLRNELHQVQGTSIKGITKDELLKKSLFICENTDEQAKIGEFFKNLDNLIAQNQKKYDKLVNMKKACLGKMFPKDGTDIPEVRAKGFSGKWKTQYFYSLYEKVSLKNDLTYGTDKIISVANMYFKPIVYISDIRYLKTYNIFKIGDIAFEGNRSKDFANGRFVENTIGNGIISHVFDVFRPKNPTYDLYFWKYAINNESLMGKILIRCTKSSTMMTNLVASDFLKEYFLVPSSDEQTKIGTFFQTLDNLITLQKTKLEKLKNIKKALLDKMFI